MANIGKESKIYEIPEPMQMPNTVPESAPVFEPEPEKVPA